MRRLAETLRDGALRSPPYAKTRTRKGQMMRELDGPDLFVARVFDQHPAYVVHHRCCEMCCCCYCCYSG